MLSPADLDFAREKKCDLEESTCPIHGTEFLRVRFRSLQVWTGECANCREAGDLDQQASERMEKRRGEVNQRVSERVAKLEKQIAKEAEAELESYLQETRKEVAPQFASYVRERFWDQAVLEVESDIKAEEIEKIKRGE
jgi:hypothetical protein